MASTTLQIPLDNRILYFARDRETFSFLSHFHPSPIELDGEIWPTAEHYYQAQKSFDLEYRQAIRSANTPGKAKRLAAPPDSPRRVSYQSWFRKHAVQPRSDWDEVKLEIMRRADSAKFTQNRELGEMLLATGDSELVEDSPFDSFWGMGRDGNGLNWAGNVLMEVRRAMTLNQRFPEVT